MPKIAILMAVYNGMPWIEEQLESILKQVAVSVHIFIADDCSDDGTYQWLTTQKDTYQNITLLPKSSRRGSAGANFYRLICDADISGFDYIAFSDQDDIWVNNKLHTQVDILNKEKLEAVSSDVLAFWSDGRQQLIKKSQSMRKLDFLFESAGPGCTFLMTPWLVGKVKEQLCSEGSMAKEVCLHDWLTYAVCRAHGRQWGIDSTPSVYYRQHDNNVLGANTGFKAKWARLLKLKYGWYRSEVQKICQVCTAITKDEEIKKIHKLIQAKTLKSQFQLMAYAVHARRKMSDRVVLMVLMLFFLF